MLGGTPSQFDRVGSCHAGGLERVHRFAARVGVGDILAVDHLQRLVAAGGRAQRAAWLLIAMLALQITLGIITLLWFVPVPIAVLHQGGAALLFAAALNMNHVAGQRAQGTEQR